jgi:hypothetical protein
VIFQSLQSLWLQDFPNLRGCFSIEWSENVLFLVHDIRASVYNRNVKQISEAYSVLSFKTFCEMLMLDRQEAEEGEFKNTLLYSIHCDYNSHASVLNCSEFDIEC